MYYQLPTYPNITATVGRPEGGLFCELTVTLQITPDRGHLLFADVIDQDEPSERIQTLLDTYVRFVLDAVELQLPFFRNVSQAEFEQILPPVEKAA